MEFNKLKRVAQQVINEQKPYRPDWDEIVYYCTTAKTMDNVSNGMTNSPANAKKQFKFDNTAQDACEDSANYLYQMCIGNIRTGFEVEIEGAQKEANAIFKDYLESEESGFAETVKNYFLESRLLGNVGIGNFIRDKRYPYIDLFTMDTAAFQRANQSKIWFMVDDRSYPVYELIETFGKDKIPLIVRDRYANDPLCRHNLKTVICPNSQYKAGAIGKNSQLFVMVRYFEESESPIDVAEIEYMPEFVSLNRTNREIYSRAPASKILNIIKALNRLVESSMYGFTQLNNPTTLLMINNAFKDLKLRKVPGGVIPMRLPQSGQAGQLSQSLQTIQDTGNTFSILREYFTNLILHAYRIDEFFQAVQQNMTATQANLVDQRTQAALISEIEPHKIVITNVLKRIFRDCWKVGMFASLNLPKEAVDNIKIKWNNYMALREKQVALSNIGDFMQYSQVLIERNPQLLAAIDDFNMILSIAEVTNQSDKIASEEDYTAVQQQAAQQQSQATQLEAGKMQSEIAKNMATASQQGI